MSKVRAARHLNLVKLYMLRKKSERYFKPISRIPFSTSNNLRNQGWVGQTSLSRSIAPPIYRGSAAQGYGGCCGQYPETEPCGLNICTPVVQTGYKPRTTKQKPIVVKDFSPLNRSASQYLAKKKRGYFSRQYWSGTAADGVPHCDCKVNANHHIGGALFTSDPYGKGVFPSQSTGMPSQSQGMYMQTKLANNRCTQRDWPKHPSLAPSCGPIAEWDYEKQVAKCRRAVSPIQVSTY